MFMTKAPNSSVLFPPPSVNLSLIVTATHLFYAKTESSHSFLNMITRGAAWSVTMRDILANPTSEFGHHQQNIRNMNTIERYFKELFYIHFFCDHSYGQYCCQQLYFADGAQIFEHAEKIINYYFMAVDDEATRAGYKHEIFVQISEAMNRYTRLGAMFGMAENGLG